MKVPAWWTPPTFRYQGRRWTDHEGSGSFDQSRRLMLALWPFLAFLAALAVVAASMMVIVNIADQRDDLARAAKSSAAAARDAKAASDASVAASEGNARVLAELTPCNPGDDPATPGCQREARTAAFVVDLVNKVTADVARGIAAHDLNTHRLLEELRRRVAGMGAPLPPPATKSPALPIPPPPVSAAPGPPVAPVPAPSPPATCPTLPNGKCRR